MKIDFTQASTQRGAIWLVFGTIGLIGWWFGKDLSQLAIFAGAVTAGLHGVTINDSNK